MNDAEIEAIFEESRKRQAETPVKGYFNIKQDIEIERNGGFFCESCLAGKPMDDVSPDHRYCQGCYELLSDEMELDTSRRSTSWHPKKQPKKPAQVSARRAPNYVHFGERKYRSGQNSPLAYH